MDDGVLKGEKVENAQPMRSYDLGLIRDQYERQRQDAEMITGLCATIFSQNKENQELKARLAALEAAALEAKAIPTP